MAAGWFYQWNGTARDQSSFPPPGRFVDVGGKRWHLRDSGGASPTVILEAGIAASCLNWTRVHTEVARFARVVSYDRASLGWSDPANSPRIISRVVDELHALLDAAQIPTPVILTGHSFGALVARCYAIKYPDEVAGLVLVDPLAAAEWLHPSAEQQKMLRRGVMLARRGAFLARFGVVRLSLALLSGGARQIPKLVARMSSSTHGETAISRLVGEVRKMPPETWPMVQAHWCQSKSFLGMAGYLESLPASSAEAVGLGELPPHIPVVIFSAANSTAAQLAERDAIARRAPNGRHILTESGHWIHLDEPEVVIAAIREMISQAKACATRCK